MKLKLIHIAILFLSLNVVAIQGEVHAKHYALFSNDVGIDDDVIGDMTAQSIDECTLMCMAHVQCVTYGFVDNKCTLSSKLVDASLQFTKYPSIGERIYSGE